MKRFFFLLSLLISFSIGQIWAAADVTYDFTGTDWTVSSGTLSNGTVSFTGAGGANFKMNSGYFMMGKSGAYINFPTYESAVEKIVVTGRSGASTAVGQNIYVGETAVSTATTGAAGENTYEIASTAQAAGTTYTLKVTTAHNTQITKIEIFYVSSGDEPGGDEPEPQTGDLYELFSGDLVEGDYVIYYSGKAMKNVVSSNRLSYLEVTPTNDIIANPDASIIWHIAQKSGSWTIYNESVKAYAASTGAKNQAALSATAEDGKSLWTVSGTETYDFVNVQNQQNSVNANLRNNGTYGFACYGTSTGGALSLYKKSDGKAAAGLAYAEADQKQLIKVGNALASPALTNPNHLTVSYASNNTDVAEVDSEDGTVTIKAAGVAVITASFAGNDDYKAGSASYTIGVTTKAGTQADPYVAADAKIAIDVMGTIENAYATGIVSNVVTTTLPAEGYITFYFSADGATTGQQIEAYKCLGLNSAKFTAVTDVETGATVVITGTLKKYNSTYEFDANCHLVSYEAPTVPKTSIANTKETAYTVAQALIYAADGVTYDLDDYVYVSGVVKKVESFNNGAMNIYIKDANVDNEFELYKCAGIHEGSTTTPFEALTDVQVGNIVIGYGQLTVYNNVKEFKQGNYLVDLQKPVTGVELNKSTETVEEDATVTLTATILPSNAMGTIVWSVESGDAYASVANGVVTGTAEGQATIRATVQGTEIYAECTVTVTAAAAPDTRKVAESPEEGFSSISGDLSGNEISFAACQGGSATPPNGNNTANELRLYKYQATTDYGGYVTITAKEGCTIDQVVITVGGNCKVGYCKDAEDFPTKESTPISVGTSNPFDSGTGLNASSINVISLDGSNQFKIKTITVYYTGDAVAPPTPSEDEISDYVLVTDLAQLQAGDKVIIVASGADKAAGSAASTYRSVVDIARTPDKSHLIFGESMPTEFTLGIPNAGEYTFHDGEGYMYESGAKSVKVQADPASWTIAIGEGNIATIKATNELRYNTSNPRFTTYESGQQTLQLYRKPGFEELRPNLEQGRLYSACMKQNIIGVQGGILWDISHYEGTKVYFEEIVVSPSAPLTAGRPFIFTVTGDFKVSYSGDEISVLPAPSGNSALRGTFSNMDQAAFNTVSWENNDSPIYMLVNNQLRQVADYTHTNLCTGNSLAANRAYLLYSALIEGQPNLAPGRRVMTMSVEENVATDINFSNGETINASKIIRNGQILILRDGKTFDVTGRELR